MGSIHVQIWSSWMENCTKFGHFILRKIIENCYLHVIFWGENAPNSISAGALPQTPIGGAYSAHPYPLAVI